MKKSGFSLAEVLITMAIIAISASMLIPAYINLKPDRYKFKVLQCYNALNEITEDLISNRDLYFRTLPPEDMTEDWYVQNHITVNGVDILNPDTEFGCNGLACTQQTNLNSGHQFIDNNFINADYSGVCKYPNLLVQAMELSNVQKCSSSNRTARGISSNRISWTIAPAGSSDNQFWSGRTYTVTIDANPRNNNSAASTENCSYNATTCPHPDRFVFSVDTGGDITGNDNLTRQYLRNMTNIEKQVDYNAAQGG